MFRINSLSHVYANGPGALDDVSIEIPTGMFTPVGPNGAGQSMLRRTATTLQTQPRAGGEATWAWRIHTLAHVALIQKIAPDPPALEATA